MSIDSASQDVVEALETALRQMINPSALTWQSVMPGLGLWLLDPSGLQRTFSAAEVRAIEEHPAYWALCWPSGVVLAQWLLSWRIDCRGKRVLDVGCGSGVVAVAAALAGAARVVACDIDADALLATRLNAESNAVSTCIEYSTDLFALSESFDLVIVADVLYDEANKVLLDKMLTLGREVWVADSRVRDFSSCDFLAVASVRSATVPDIDPSDQFRFVGVYKSVMR